eukprot:TRINITY_DN56692_c0_g1_i1.p1 TRINITY_DN56692_c0_g1~~TRINITY_DN56692_c0_g1_i1.p1  ORF type:complete len:422 (-),score=40.37 TRINITY_DN56692_c0_g1_i1:532-1716(-)
MTPRFRPPPLALANVRQSCLPQTNSDQAEHVTSLYSWRKTIGSGTYGVVKEAVRCADGLLVAVKNIHHGGDEDKKRRIQQEHEFLSSLDHESIVKVLGFHELASESWLCMEICAHGPLSSYIDRKGALPDCRTRTLSWQLVDGLNHLHAKRIVHRDIKPANLILKDAMHLLIADFGSAKRIGKKDVQSAMLTHRGSSLFSAPEVLFDRAWNERVDVWSCGLCIYYMCQASLPFDINVSEVRQRLKHGSFDSLAWGDSTDDVVKSFIGECLIVDPMLRPPILQLAHHKFLAEKVRPLTRSRSEEVLGKQTRASTSFKVSDWQERRCGQDLLAQLADSSVSRERERRNGQNSCDSLNRLPPEDNTAILIGDKRPTLRRKKRRLHTTYGDLHNLGGC